MTSKPRSREPLARDFLEDGTRWAGLPRCGEWMPMVGAPCDRIKGHKGGKGGGHRSRAAMDYDVERKHR